MLVLALDTSTDAVVVGVVEVEAVDPGPASSVTVLAEQVCPGARRHSEQLMPALLEVCASAGRRPSELDAVVCGIGPGPFTGLRVGIASAAAFADALGVPAYGVCSLDAIASGVETAGVETAGHDDRPLLVVTDARRREVYWAAYAGIPRVDGAAVVLMDGAAAVLMDGAAVVRRTEGPGVDTPATLAERVAELGVRWVAGTMAEELAGSLGLAVHPARRPTAAGLVTAALPTLRAADEPAPLEAAPLEPLYLRRPDAVPPGARKRVTAGAAGTPGAA